MSLPNVSRLYLRYQEDLQQIVPRPGHPIPSHPNPMARTFFFLARGELGPAAWLGYLTLLRYGR